MPRDENFHFQRIARIQRGRRRPPPITVSAAELDRPGSRISAADLL
jgi:hypothetical protein